MNEQTSNEQASKASKVEQTNVEQANEEMDDRVAQRLRPDYWTGVLLECNYSSHQNWLLVLVS